jgi:hypothetical protein
MFKKIGEWYKRQTDFTKVCLWMVLALVIGVIIRWNYIVEGAARGFNFLKK